MRIALRVSAIGVLAAVLVLGTQSVGHSAVHAADMAPKGTTSTTMAAPSSTSGTLVGDRGGAYASWNVTLPANKDVTLTLWHWPCTTHGAIGVDVWGAAARLATSHEKDACTETAWFNTGAGGPATIRVYDYLHGVGTMYTLTAEGLSLTGAKPATVAAPAERMAAPAPMAPMAAPGAAMAPADKPMAAMKPAASASMTAGGSLNHQNQVLLGNAGGAWANHDIMAKEGETYTVKLHHGTDMGGTWPGIGFKVWGPGGWVVDSHAMSHGISEAWFKASGNVKYTVAVYNYHPGVTAFYGIEAKSGSAAQ